MENDQKPPLAPLAPWLAASQAAATPPVTPENGATASETPAGGTTPPAPTENPVQPPPVVESVVAKVEEAVEKVAAEIVDTVTVTIPKAFQLRMENNTVHPYKAGVQEMLREHAEHWWARANGVVIYNK